MIIVCILGLRYKNFHLCIPQLSQHIYLKTCITTHHIYHTTSYRITSHHKWTITVASVVILGLIARIFTCKRHITSHHITNDNYGSQLCFLIDHLYLTNHLLLLLMLLAYSNKYNKVSPRESHEALFNQCPGGYVAYVAVGNDRGRVLFYRLTHYNNHCCSS